VTALALAWDGVVALAAVALAAAYLVARGVRVVRRRGAGGCGCGDAKAAGGCGAAGGPTIDDLRRAAERGARRAASK
jgi:hypothetical protein